MMEKTQSLNVIDKIKELMNDNERNTDLTTELIVHFYQSASDSEKDIINKICLCLTGIQFDTILQRTGIQSYPDNRH